MCRGGGEGLQVGDQACNSAAEVSEAAGGRDGFRETRVEAALEGA